MITTRTAKQCGQADFGWLQARYTFPFGHYFDPKLLGYAFARAQPEVLAPGASFQPRYHPKVDILNLDSGRGSGNIVTVMATAMQARLAKRC